MKFERIKSPIAIKGLKLKNRMVMAPMVTNYCTREGFVTQRVIDYYEERAKGGVALIITEAACVSYPIGLSLTHQLGIYDDRQILGLKKMVDAIHKHDCKISIQLHHAGLRAPRNITGYKPVSASTVSETGRWSHWVGGNPPRALSTSEVERLVEAFVNGAMRAKTARADAVQLHGAHGYLILNFLSPLYNRRTDKYGGDTAGRTRFAEEIVQKIKQRAGQDFPVMFRISGQESVEGGLTLDEAKIICQILEKAGIDSFDVTSGSQDSFQEVVPSSDFAPGWRVFMAESIKKAVSVPVMTTGRIHHPEIAESILNEGKVDLIGLGRALICDPEFPKKISEGIAEEIRWCVACNQGCIDRLRSIDLDGNSMRTCLYNPLSGHERTFALKPSVEKKRVVVIGGGAAGMETAVISALRGHDVILFEKQKVLGGQMILAAIPPNKNEINNIIRYYENQLNKFGVKVKMGRSAVLDDIEQLNPDAVILASGGTPVVPNIPGFDRENVVQAWDVLQGKEVGENILIVGGGMVGCETADFLAEKCKKVTLVEQFSNIAEDMGFIRRVMLFERFTKYPITIKVNAQIQEIKKGVVIAVNGEQIEAETVVLALGVTANRNLEIALRDKAWDLYCVGDCDMPGSIMTAVHRAFHVARKL